MFKILDTLKYDGKYLKPGEKADLKSLNKGQIKALLDKEVIAELKEPATKPQGGKK